MNIESILKYFEPDAAGNASLSDIYRGKILVGASLTAVVCILIFILIRGTWSGFDHYLSYMLIIGDVSLICSLFIYKRTGSIQLAGLIMIISGGIALMAYTYFDGGLYSTALGWFPILPLFTVFFSGYRYGVLIGAVLIGYLLLLLSGHYFGLVPATQLEPGQHQFLYAVSISTVLIILLFLASSYLNWQEAAKEELHRANMVKNEFLSGVSHELRTPLNAVIGISEILTFSNIGPLNQQQRNYVDLIGTSGSHLLALVNDLLDITKIESGQFELDTQLLPIKTLIEEVVSIQKSKAESKQIDLKFELSQEASQATATVDPLRFKQILINLISNAIKFTQSGGTVVVRAGVAEDKLVIRIIDNGPGIPDEDIEQVFERFYQVHREESSKEEGTGLGLPLSRDLAEMHGGDLVASNNVGKGATLTLTIPVST